MGPACLLPSVKISKMNKGHQDPHGCKAWRFYRHHFQLCLCNVQCYIMLYSILKLRNFLPWKILILRIESKKCAISCNCIYKFTFKACLEFWKCALLSIEYGRQIDWLIGAQSRTGFSNCPCPWPRCSQQKLGTRLLLAVVYRRPLPHKRKPLYMARAFLGNEGKATEAKHP